MKLAEKKITKATFKSFLNKNKNELYINVHSTFNGMIDCVDTVEHNMSKAQYEDTLNDNTCGIKGVWLVSGSRNWFTYYSDEIFEGIEASNCYGSFTVARIK